jgi:NAD(P)H-hydrate epimerase
MLYALNVDEMRTAEERAVAEGGPTPATLMERAGAAVATDAAAGVPAGRIAVVCGKGNNGGDGWVAAREMLIAGRDAFVLTLVDPAELGSPAKEAAQAAIAAGVPWNRPDSDAELVRGLTEAVLVVDAIFGFGFRGPVREPYARAIAAINDAHAAVLSVDVPSGVEADTGTVTGDAVRADVTLTFSAPKVGLVQYPGAAFSGEVRVADIGVPREIIDEVGGVELLDQDDYLDLFPFTPADAHKGSRGRVLVVAGSRGMTGAAALAAEAALKAGAGYVLLACPDSLVETLACKLTSVVIRPLPESERGVLAARSAEEVLRLAEGYDAVVLGPGLTTAEGPAAVSRRLVAELVAPLVVDADALNALAAAGGAQEVLAARRSPTVVTPHPGELARLLGVDTGEIQSDRLAYAARLASAAVTCVLKGAGTVVAGEGRRLINMSGNAGMATAGSGDVLAGVLGALLAKGMTPFEAAALGAYLHGRAGDHAARALTEECVTATDILGAIPDAVGELLGRVVPPGTTDE